MVRMVDLIEKKQKNELMTTEEIKAMIESYTKEVKVPLDDGTFDTTEETVDSYKIKSYRPVV